ncbi:MAG: class II fructose-bisphosphate aldolase [Candidatus Yanofskybacteria bacterium]|nr:class II fructose-bisphosphate aldolase [Candidatus Yanofskybacteria bacterium]
MKTLKQYFNEAVADKWALGHFNFSTADQLKAFVEAAMELKSPIMVGTSESEADFVGREQAVALVKSYQKNGHAVFLNADHHKSWETTKAVVNAGYDSVLIDASKHSYEENIVLTKKVVDYAQSFNLEVEGELGYLRGSSEVQEKIEISPADYTQPEQARDFVTRTGVDRLAVAFGNIHGIVTNQEEHLDIGHLKKIVQAIPVVPLVLHGASGLPAEEIKMAIQNGIANVHINTELRVAYHDTLHEELEKEPKETTPYKYLKSSYEEMKRMIKKYLELFGSVGKI